MQTLVWHTRKEMKMKMWLTIIAIRLGIVKIVLAYNKSSYAIKERMEKLGLTQKDIARALKCSTSCIHKNIKRGSGTYLNKIENYLAMQERNL
ncbi:MAG: helix-turn-helix transcriptional regulator [Melioribacteraceae bacterium]|nr:helix-turn-helix transcriptional regulator [Melioribacteraceae bacterium]